MELSNLIIASNDLGELKPVDVPQWPGTAGKLFVRHMTVKQKAVYIAEVDKLDKGKPCNFKVLVALYCLCDESGKRVFDDTQLEALSGKSESAIDAIYQAWSTLERKSSEVDQKKD